MAYLEQKCTELVNDKNDDAFIRLLKKKNNDLEQLIDENEQEYDMAVKEMKKEILSLHRQNNSLVKKINEMDLPNNENQLKDLQSRVNQYEKLLLKKNETNQDLLNENQFLRKKLDEVETKMREEQRVPFRVKETGKDEAQMPAS